MKRFVLSGVMLLMLIAGVIPSIVAQHGNDMMMTQPFVHGFVFTIDGEDYQMAGALDDPNSEIDIPGHEWIRISDTEQFVKTKRILL